MSETRIAFISAYAGRFDYRVLGGSLDGSRITVRVASPEWYAAQWNGGKDWNFTAEEYQSEVIARAGTISCLGRGVPEDVVAAVNLERPLASRGPNSFQGPYRSR